MSTINLIINVIDESLMVSEIVHNTDGSFTETPIRFAQDINEVSSWVRSRGGHLGAIVSNHPIHHRCRQAQIEYITVDDVFNTQQLWGDVDVDITTHARYISAERLSQIEHIPFTGQRY